MISNDSNEYWYKDQTRCRLMATSSFDRPLEIKNDKAAAKLIEAEKSHKAIRKIDISRELERGRSFLEKRYSH